MQEAEIKTLLDTRLSRERAKQLLIELVKVPMFLGLFLVVRGLPALLLYRSELGLRDRVALAVYSATKGMTTPPNRSPLLASTKSALNVKGPAPLIR